jgi:osmotically-inducible protein OsmY
VHPAIDASDIDVAVTNGDVDLSGCVESRAVKRLVEAIAEAVPGVKEIENRLRVNQGSRSTRMPCE